MINIPLDVDVECTDGRAGKSSSVIVNRKTLQVTHFVVKEKERPQTERLVPIEYVQESAADRIRLSCTINELQEMQEFVTINYRQVEIIRYSASNYGAVPYYTPEIETYEYQEEQVPMGGVSIRSGLEVQASDGKVGRAVNLLEDPESGQIPVRTGNQPEYEPLGFARYERTSWQLGGYSRRCSDGHWCSG